MRHVQKHSKDSPPSYLLATTLSPQRSSPIIHVLSMQLSNISIPTHRNASFHLRADTPTYPHHPTVQSTPSPHPPLHAHPDLTLHKPSTLQVLENHVPTPSPPSSLTARTASSLPPYVSRRRFTSPLHLRRSESGFRAHRFLPAGVGSTATCTCCAM